MNAADARTTHVIARAAETADVGPDAAREAAGVASPDDLPGDASRDPAGPAEDRLNDLERQMLRGAMHAHTVDSRLAERINALESAVYGLVDLLVEKRLMGEAEIVARAERMTGLIEGAREQVHGEAVLRVDPEDAPEFVPVDCAERMPICKAVCCKLSFPLTAEEVESGSLKWDLGMPYFIRHDAHGGCVHRDPDSGACGVYAGRPALCKRYSCANDTRIWKDFEGRVLNQEWIDAHLGVERPRLIRIRMENG